ncbi:MAG: hypothetical protein AAB539_03865 [Patescibacteria group bacterium]
MGVSNVALVTKLVVLAEERHRTQKRTVYTFPSDVLTKIRGQKM